MNRSGTHKALLFSEQVALSINLDEPTAAVLKRYLELAHDPTRMPKPKPFIGAAGMLATLGLIAMATAAFLPDGRGAALIAAPLLFASAGWAGRMAFLSQEREAAALIEKLAHGISKRNKELK